MTSLVRDHCPDWRSWRAPELPPLPQIDAWDGPWCRDITRVAVDAARTAALADLDTTVSAVGGVAPWDGSSPGQPYDVVTDNRRLRIWDLSQPARWSWSGLITPTVDIPAPETIRREGDPMGAFDRHARIVTDRTLTEAICVEQPVVSLTRLLGVPWQCGYPGGGRGVVTYDLTRRHRAGSGGVVAARVPHLPMIIRHDELERGNIGHCLFGVVPDYAPDKTGWAEGTDGTVAGHPVRAGEILRLRPDIAGRWERGTPEHTVATAMTVHGVFIGDKHGDPKAGLKVTVAQDRRIGRIELGLTTRDFEIVHQGEPS